MARSHLGRKAGKGPKCFASVAQCATPQALSESKNVAACVVEWIEPAFALMGYDDNRCGAAAILHGMSGALGRIQLPTGFL
ncbi:hypothetical protein AS149_12495 [Burkholderia cenocepacia]|nr:hypothetical protein AS149_12495 [Burkholderia cenocepacia]